MTISAQDAMTLRKQTGVGLMTCKKALQEANGDMEAAVEILRKKGEAKAASKADRETAEGRVGISGDAIVHISCETDFVGKNENFIAFVQSIADKAQSDGVDATREYFETIKGEKIQEIGENMSLVNITKVEDGTVRGGYVHTNGKIATLVALEGGTEEQARDVAMHATAMNPLVANPEDVPAETIEKEKEIYREQLIAEGKPEKILDNIIAGKVKKFCAERALSSQPFVKDPSQTVAEYLGDAKLVSFTRFEV